MILRILITARICDFYMHDTPVSQLILYSIVWIFIWYVMVIVEWLSILDNFIREKYNEYKVRKNLENNNKKW